MSSNLPPLRKLSWQIDKKEKKKKKNRKNGGGSSKNEDERIARTGGSGPPLSVDEKTGIWASCNLLCLYISIEVGLDLETQQITK